MKDRRLLILEPYWGGSHSQFLTGLQQHLDAECQLMCLPARNWKMRMQLSAPWAVNCLRKLPCAQRRFDTVLCSTFMDVAVLRSLLANVAGWSPTTRFCAYFHENQFAYPGQFEQTLNRQFAAVNYTTALTSDRIAFNSRYNRDTFLAGCGQYLKKAGEMGVGSTIPEIRHKSRILAPGLDYALLDSESPSRLPASPVIIWNHRWEHDKNPEEFFAALSALKGQEVDFKLIVLGQSFGREPRCFQEARSVLADRILHFGYALGRQEYCDLLKQGTIAVSTARHEFFGIAVLEAVRAGCRPLLPDRLAYPEFFEGRYLYPENGLIDGLAALLRENRKLPTDEVLNITDKYNWQTVRRDYAEWLFGA